MRLLAAAGAQQVCCWVGASDGAAGGDARQAAGAVAPWAGAGTGAAGHTVSPSTDLLPWFVQHPRYHVEYLAQQYADVTQAVTIESACYSTQGGSGCMTV